VIEDPESPDGFRVEGTLRLPLVLGTMDGDPGRSVNNGRHETSHILEVHAPVRSHVADTRIVVPTSDARADGPIEAIAIRAMEMERESESRSSGTFAREHAPAA
jgi:hypothetical protein